MNAMHASHSRRLGRALWGLAAAILAGHLCVTLLGLLPDQASWITSGWTPAVAFALCGACCLARGAAPAPDRSAWLVLGTGLLLYALGQAWYLSFERGGDGGLDAMSTVWWLLLYPAGIAAVALLVRARGVPLRRDLWLDGATAGLTISAAGALILFEFVINPVDAAQAAPANLVFALGDLLVIGFGIGACAVLGWRPPLALVALIAAFCAQGVEDTLYLHHILHGHYPEGLDTAWIASVLTIGAVGAWAPGVAGAPRALGARALAAFPLASAVIAVVLVMYMALVDDMNALPVVLTGLALVAVALRCTVTFMAHVATIEAKERMEAHLSEAQRLAGIGSWEYGGRDRRVRWSAEMARLHGWADRDHPPQEVDEFLELLDPASHDACLAELNAAMAGADAVSVEYRLRDTERVLRLEAKIARDPDGGLVRVVGTTQDVTERFARVEAERANKAKNEFLSRMSHELRTPLNAVLGFGQLLQASELTERQHGNVGHILGAGRHLVDLVDEVLDLARIEGGQLSLSLEPVDLRAVVAEAIDLITPLAAGHAVAVAARVGAQPLWVQADQQRLKQVLLNLLSNGVKYNHDGGRVDVSASVDAEGRVRVDVADTGVGIAPQDVPRLFEPFERLGAQGGDIEGTGLGLPLTLGLVEAMGGALAVHSRPGSGSTFSIELAAACPARAGAAVAPARPAAAPHEGPQRRVLCIEDNVSNLSLMEEVFAARPDVRLDTAVQGTMGVDLAREHHPDLVLLDLNLPDLSGAEVLRRLRADAETAGIPVVVVSADATPRQIDQLMAAGAHDYVTKPIDIQRLLRVVDDALGAVPVP